ncbi:FeoA family protein [Aquimarina rhabdastrellae]
MKSTLAALEIGKKGIIKEIALDQVPLKLIEMGCLPGSEVELLRIAPFNGPMYLNIEGNHLAMRKETATYIEVELI